MSITERLRERIAHEGPISFRDFMAAALYDPQEGYYARGAAIGERGDFVTSPYVSPAFARAIARRFASDAQALEGPLDFVDVGAGEGKFLEDFATALEAQAREVASRVRLTAVERSASARQTLLRRPFPRPCASWSRRRSSRRRERLRLDLLQRVVRRSPGRPRDGIRAGPPGAARRFRGRRVRVAPRRRPRRVPRAPGALRRHAGGGPGRGDLVRRGAAPPNPRARARPRVASSRSTTATALPFSTIRRRAGTALSRCTSGDCAAAIRFRGRVRSI